MRATAYRGELRNGQSNGVGLRLRRQSRQCRRRTLRYEGEHASDLASGHGVIFWRGGDSFAGQGAGSPGQARGVLTYGNGQRYEGEMVNGQRQGIGIVWGADGTIAQAGRWARDELVEPMKAVAP